MSLGSDRSGDVTPNLIAAERNYHRYPNQFFDLSQQYMPPTIKELFRWCTFYYYNSPLIGSALKKVSRYPITDLIYEDPKDSVRSVWEDIFDKKLKIKVKLMEVNLDLHVYGNSFVSLHLPTTRILKCPKCRKSAPIQQWKWRFVSYGFYGQCDECNHDGELEVTDRAYKDVSKVKVIRWNPENVEIKYNEYTGTSVYLYTVPRRLRMAIEGGDKDIVSEMPLIVIQAVKEKKKIKMNPSNFMHMKNATLAEQDQGWGKPSIIHVLKDMFYFYTLRRAQEAIALEHIVPFDIIYPMPNAQMDPYVHSDLGDWKRQVENIIAKHRRDPNFKAVIPIPVGFGRLGGDGKALLLGPELQYLTQTVVGGMGIPQEFLFGGLNWTGSSVSLRTLENDFIQNRSQLLDLVYWVKDRVRAWLSCPDIESMRFADFRMADDIQKNQQLIGLNAQGKVSDQTLLTELGYDYEEEVKKRLEEIYIQNHMNDILTKGQARSQGEAGLIGFNFQQRMNEIAQQAQQAAEDKMHSTLKHDNSGYIEQLVGKLIKLDPSKAEGVLAQMKMQVPEVGASIETAYRGLVEAQKEMERQIQQQQAQMEMMAGEAPGNFQDFGTSGGMSGATPATAAANPAMNPAANPAMAAAKQQSDQMRPAPEQQPPRRQGGV